MLKTVLAATLLVSPTSADLSNTFPDISSESTIVAQDVAVVVPVNTPTVVTLYGWQQNNAAFEFFIFSVPDPSVGTIYETSQSFRTTGEGYPHTTEPITNAQLPFKVTDPENRIVFVPADNLYGNVDMWCSIKYYTALRDGYSGPRGFGWGQMVGRSDPGIIAFLSPAAAIAWSDFSSDLDGWTVTGNGETTDGLPQLILQEHSSKINRYMYVQDAIQYFDENMKDELLWFFQAPSKFLVEAMATAFRGFIKFNIKASFGAFCLLHINTSPKRVVPWIVLECEKCDSDRGMRIVYPLRVNSWDGSETTIEIPLDPDKWWRDPLNLALEYRQTSECEMYAVLKQLTKFLILGDFSQGPEGIMIDDIRVEAPVSVTGDNNPSVPRDCQRGCECQWLNAGSQRQDNRNLNCCTGSCPIDCPSSTNADGTLIPGECFEQMCMKAAFSPDDRTVAGADPTVIDEETFVIENCQNQEEIPYAPSTEVAIEIPDEYFDKPY